jgi:hypothetical protein
MKQKVYLAGGLHTNWQEKVKSVCSFFDKPIPTSFGHLPIGEPYFDWLDPKEKEFKDGIRIGLPLEQYTLYDLVSIKRSDILFLYMEKTNPGVGGLIEAGYAKGLGKTVITVLEKGNTSILDRYLDFVKGVSDITFETLEEGINYLYLLK